MRRIAFFILLASAIVAASCGSAEPAAADPPEKEPSGLQINPDFKG